MSHRAYAMICSVVLAAACVIASGAEPVRRPPGPQPPKPPIIVDTDIGDDIADTWALAVALRIRDYNLRLIMGDNCKALYRAKLIAKMCEVAKRTDVAVGIGLGREDLSTGKQAKWVENYDLKSYPGQVYEDGVQAMVDTIMAAPRSAAVIALGPAPNIAEALRREPRIAEKTIFIGMYGSFRRGYDGQPPAVVENNIKQDIKSCQAIFNAKWRSMTIVPLDASAQVRLTGQRYRQVLESKAPLAMAVIENYRLWCGDNLDQADVSSTVLSDTVATYLVYSNQWVQFQPVVRVRVRDDGMTVIDPGARPITVITGWQDLGAFKDMLVSRITEPDRISPGRR